jgi:type II secretory pathway pseudopilin PulG
MTLLELIIVIAIMSIVSLMVLSVFVYTLNTYQRAIERRKEQSEVRLVSDLITTDVRNALEVSLVDDEVADCLGYSMHLDGSQFKRYILSSGSSQKFTDEYVTGINMFFIPDDNDPDKFYLDFTVFGKNGYNLNSRVLLNNIDSLPSDSGSEIITYRK